MKKQLGKKLLSFILLMMLVIGIFISCLVIQLFTRPMLKTGDKPVLVNIAPHTSAIALVNQLAGLKLIPSKAIFLALIRIRGVSNQLKAGVYQILPNETAVDLLTHIIKGEVLIKSFQIIEGTTLSVVKAHLQQAAYLYFNQNDLEVFALPYQSNEGLFLADTYYYKAGSNAQQVLRLAKKNLLSVLLAKWKERSDQLPYQTPYELLIAASIIEKESALPSERKIIAGIIANRLKNKMPLQMDPTVIYALGEKYRGQLSHQDLSVASPFNTYRFRGLPPTPIAMVGKESIAAAANPQQSGFLYFFAKGDGSHQFSRTYSEQKKAINQYKAHHHD